MTSTTANAAGRQQRFGQGSALPQESEITLGHSQYRER